MSTAVKLAGFFLAFATVGWAQDALSVRNQTNQRWPAAEGQRIYLSACAGVQREFGRTLPLVPKVTLVLGADKNEVWFVGGEVRLTKWNRDAFAEGVVWLAFFNLMPSQQRLTIARQALNVADSTVDIEEFKK